MQTLYFEEAWERTVSRQDREKIKKHFAAAQLGNEVAISFLWEAINHHNDKLVTALIHNPTETSLEINQMPISFMLLNGERVTNLFQLPVPIPANTSMPWTFIFNKQNQSERNPFYTIDREST